MRYARMDYFMEYLRGLIGRTNVVCNQLELSSFSTNLPLHLNDMILDFQILVTYKIGFHKKIVEINTIYCDSFKK